MSRKGRIKIPHTAIETFVNIARKDNGDTQELLCYFLGEKGKVDTILLPKQDRKPSSMFDQGKNSKFYSLQNIDEGMNLKKKLKLMGKFYHFKNVVQCGLKKV